MQEILKEYLLALPRVALLIPKLLTDDRVPTRTKVTMVGMGFYIISPWDLIPDFIPILGQLDDLTALLLLLDGVLNQIDDDILLEHWTGDESTLRFLQSAAWLASLWVPTRVKRFFFAHVEQEGERRYGKAQRRLKAGTPSD